MWRPRLHERLKATISHQDDSGVFLTVNFFDNIFVPSHLLKDPSEYDPARRQWRYLPLADSAADDSQAASSQPEKGAGLVQYAPYENGAQVIFSVHAAVEAVLEGGQTGLGAAARDTTAVAPPAAFSVQGSFVDPGLGPMAWFEHASGSFGGDDAAAHDGS